MDEKPLIWTSKGNLPMELLQFAPSWEDTPEYTKLTLTYTLDGEVVKQSHYVYVKKGVDLGAIQGGI